MEVFLKGDQLKGSMQGFSFNLDALDENTFQPRNWLSETGLAGLLGAPVDLRQLTIDFIPGDAISPDTLIINLGGFAYEICPEYPAVAEIPPLWEELTGDYDLVARLPSGQSGTDVLGQTSIYITEGVLEMAGFAGPLLPVSETEIIILTGPFAGETMVYDPLTGKIHHQNIEFVER